MGKPTGFMEYSREKVGERNPLTRQNDWKEYTVPFSDEKLRTQGRGAWIAPSPSAIPEWRFKEQHLAVRFTT